MGWETLPEVAQRFDEAVRARSEPGRELVIGTHGMALTAWLIHCGRVEHGAAATRFWAALEFPDIVEVHLC